MIDIDPEGFYRDPDPLCVCGPLYIYGDDIDPGGYAEDCPIHGDPKVFNDEVTRLREEIEALAREREAYGRGNALDPSRRLRDLLGPTEGETDDR